MIKKIFKLGLLFLGVLTMLLCAGCQSDMAGRQNDSSYKSHNRPYPKRGKGIYHTVRWQGETLSIISMWYTGSSDNWRAIQRHNRGISVKGLKIGHRLFIPGFMLVNHGPMPKPFLKKHSKKTTKKQYKKSKKYSKKSKKQAKKSKKTEPELSQEEIQPFGPKD